MMSALRGKKHLNKRPGYRVTVLLDNFVDKDIQSMLLPLNLMQNMLFYPKYRIKDNFIYPNSMVLKLVSFCVMIFSITFYCYHIYDHHFNTNLRQYLNISYITSYFDLILYSIGFVINYNINVLQTNANISFVMNIQKVHRFLNEKPLYKRFVIWNWISSMVIFGNFIFIIVYCYKIGESSIASCLNSISLLCLDLNYISAIRYIKLLSNKVDLWNNQTQILQQMDHSEIEIYCKKMFQAYVNILESYEIYKNSFQYTVRYD